MVDLAGPEFVASATGCVVEDDFAWFGCSKGREEVYNGEG
jgi:hypothetical protein